MTANAVLPSAAAGMNLVGAKRDNVSQQQATPLVQKSLNSEGGTKQVDTNQALLRQVNVAKSSLAKKEEELAALVQQLQSRDRKVTACEQKIQGLERMSRAQVAEIGGLKKEIISSVGLMHAEKLSKIVDAIQDANSQLCEQFGSISEVCFHFLPHCWHIGGCSCLCLISRCSLTQPCTVCALCRTGTGSNITVLGSRISSKV